MQAELHQSEPLGCPAKPSRRAISVHSAIVCRGVSIALNSDKKQRPERWSKDLAVEQEVIEPAEVRDNPEAFRVSEKNSPRCSISSRRSFFDVRSFAAS